ncbi:MAG: sel1 repeat family protein, partial [Phenylobacterium sp.]|nr:sel1 repeat family protein [Phenylobacterium sp.]
MSRSFTRALAGFACAVLASAVLPGIAGAEEITDCGATYAKWNDGPTEDTPDADWARLFEACKKQADAGNAAAQYAVGEMYRLGPPEGPADDDAKAAEYYAKAAAQENNDARFSLGLAYEDGAGVRKDVMKGVQWIRMAADDGFTPAQYYLGRLFRNGTSVPQSDADAFEWFSKAAALGHVDATNTLALMHHEGQATPVDHETEMKWFRRAAEAGSGLAQYQLGAGYANEHGL